MSVPRSPINALHWLGGVAAVGFTIWHWHAFSGPFLSLIDLQVLLTGRWYGAPLAVALLVGALLDGEWLHALMPRREAARAVLRRLPPNLPLTPSAAALRGDGS